MNGLAGLVSDMAVKGKRTRVRRDRVTRPPPGLR